MPPLPIFEFSIDFLQPTVSARVVLFKHPKDVYVLRAHSDVPFSPKIFRPPLPEFSGSASVGSVEFGSNLH